MRLFRNKIVRLLVVLGGITLIIGLSQSVYSLWRKKDVIRERQEVLEQAAAENRRLKGEFERVQSTGYIEKEAREKLGLSKEGETIVLMDQSQNINLNPQDREGERQLPYWKQWWTLFF